MAETFNRSHYGPIAHPRDVAVGVVNPPTTDNGYGDYERNLVRITRTTYAAGVSRSFLVRKPSDKGHDAFAGGGWRGTQSIA